MSVSSVPFLDLVTPHKELSGELTAVFEQVLNTAYFIGGPMVSNFESEFANFCESEFSIALNSGTDAVRFALIASGIRQGDVVLTVPNTFIATVEGISQAGGLTEFVEINEETFSLDPQKLEQHLSENCYRDSISGQLISKRYQRPVKAIVPVHLYGQIADMDPIMNLAEKYNLIVVEDACQAHGAKYFSEKQNKWQTAGSIGHAAAFSFYPGKNLGAMGEGGAVTTNTASINKMVRMLRDHGQVEKYIHEIEGYNGRMDALQAGFLSVKLKHLAKWNESRRAAAHYYTEQLAKNDKIICFTEQKWSVSSFHLYIIRVANRQKIQDHCNSLNIGTGLHYPVPLHLQKAYTTLHYTTGAFPITEKTSEEILSLPLFPGITKEQQDYVIDGVIKAV